MAGLDFGGDEIAHGEIVLRCSNGAAITAASTDLVQLNEVARRVFNENLERLRTDQAFHYPAGNRHAIQRGARLLDVLDSKSDVKASRILMRALGPRWRRAGRP